MEQIAKRMNSKKPNGIDLDVDTVILDMSPTPKSEAVNNPI